jgi:Domain of unknown function (DUF4157)
VREPPEETPGRRQEPDPTQGPLGPGRPLDGGVRARMERGFGRRFDDVRVHDDARAASEAARVGASAFTVGRQVVLGTGRYRPGTLDGDVLLAHELAHVAQQHAARGRGGGGAVGADSLEADADRSAVSTALVGVPAPTRLRGGVRLHRCETRSPAALRQAQETVVLALGDPDANADQIIAQIEALGGDAPAVLRQVAALKNDQRLQDIATYPGGRRILERARQALEGGDVVDRQHARRLQELLARYQAPAARATAQDQRAIDNINAAVAGESAEQRALYQRPPHPLRLPIRLYERGREEIGGVYYDPGLPRDAARDGEAGVTYTATPRGMVGERTYLQFHAGYIRIGPLALTSPDSIRSTLHHEYQHYRLQVERARPEAATDPALLKLREEVATGAAAAKPDEELEVTSTQIVEDFDHLADAEVRTLLRYLATYLADPNASELFVKRAVDRIVAFVAGDEARRRRLLALIRAEGPSYRRMLERLVKALAPIRPTRPARERGP